MKQPFVLSNLIERVFGDMAHILPLDDRRLTDDQLTCT